jgi:uncharacterized protein
MSEHDEFQAGVPCWVDTLQPDPTSAVGFYAELFGWEVENRTASDSPRKYFVCKLRGRAVAGVGSRPSEGVPSDWNTYVRVDSVEEAAAKAVESGGSVVLEPFDWLDGGRAAMLEDHAGAALGVLEPGAHRGAQVVNDLGAWAMSVLNTRDVEGSKRFYGTVFGWDTLTFDAGGRELTMWRLPGYVGGCRSSRCHPTWSPRWRRLPARASPSSAKPGCNPSWRGPWRMWRLIGAPTFGSPTRTRLPPMPPSSAGG